MMTIGRLDGFCRLNINEYQGYEPYSFKKTSFILNFKKNEKEIPLNACVSYIRKITDNLPIINRSVGLHHIYQNGDVELIFNLG